MSTPGALRACRRRLKESPEKRTQRREIQRTRERDRRRTESLEKRYQRMQKRRHRRSESTSCMSPACSAVSEANVVEHNCGHMTLQWALCCEALSWWTGRRRSLHQLLPQWKSRHVLPVRAARLPTTATRPRKFCDKAFFTYVLPRTFSCSEVLSLTTAV